MNLAKRQAIFALVVAIILLVGIALILVGGAIALAIGTSLVASGIVSLLEMVHRFVISEDNQIAKQADAAGLSAIYARRDLDRYHDLMTLTSGIVDISGYSLRAFFDSFKDSILAKAKKTPTFRARLLLVDPSIDVSKQRERIEGLTRGTFKTSMKNLVDAFSGVPNIEVRLLRTPLTTMVFRLDGTMFIGPQLMSVPSKGTPTFELRADRGAWLFSAYEREFEELWNESRPVNEETRNA